MFFLKIGKGIAAVSQCLLLQELSLLPMFCAGKAACRRIKLRVNPSVSHNSRLLSTGSSMLLIHSQFTLVMETVQKGQNWDRTSQTFRSFMFL